MKSCENTIRKLPILCAWIKEINRKSNNATVLLNDFSEDIKGTLSNSIIKDYWSSLMIGSVIFLQDVNKVFKFFTWSLLINYLIIYFKRHYTSSRSFSGSKFIYTRK